MDEPVQITYRGMDRTDAIEAHITVLPHGRVTDLFPGEGYGFVEDLDGLRVYFHRNAVLNDRFDALSVGSVVRYVLARGEGKEGPQASTVELSEP